MKHWVETWTMKTLQLSLAVLAGTISILCASYHIGFSTDEPTSILDSSMPPIIMTQVELWGPSSFHTDNIIQCEDNETSLGPWAVGWVEIYNTKNDSITISDVDLKGKGWEEGQFPMTLGPQEYCYIVTQNQVSTRIGVGGSLGNGPPPHDNVTTILSYSVQSFDKKMNYTYSTPQLSDDPGDAKTWQLVDGRWVFLGANFKQELSTKTIMSPLEQFRSGIADMSYTNSMIPVELQNITSHFCNTMLGTNEIDPKVLQFVIDNDPNMTKESQQYEKSVIAEQFWKTLEKKTVMSDLKFSSVGGINNSITYVPQNEASNLMCPGNWGLNGTFKTNDGKTYNFEFNASDFNYDFNTTLQASNVVIPEFPFTIPVLLISITSLIVFYRISRK